MQKDYAKYPSSARQKKVASGWQKRLTFICFLLIAIVGFGAGLYFIKTHDVDLNQSTRLWLAQLKSIGHKNTKKVEPLTEVAKATDEMADDSEIHFDFYTELPKMQVTIPDTNQSS